MIAILHLQFLKYQLIQKRFLKPLTMYKYTPSVYKPTLFQSCRSPGLTFPGLFRTQSKITPFLILRRTNLKILGQSFCFQYTFFSLSKETCFKNSWKKLHAGGVQSYVTFVNLMRLWTPPTELFCQSDKDIFLNKTFQ